MKNLCFFLLLILTVGCASEPENTTVAAALPNTPETVTRQWQEYVDTDKFVEAAELSTPRAREWLLMIEKFLEGLPPEETAEIYRTDFAEMSCTETGNAAACACVIREEGELIRDTFILQKINGQWAVDVPEEVTEEGAEEVEGFIDSLMQATE